MGLNDVLNGVHFGDPEDAPLDWRSLDTAKQDDEHEEEDLDYANVIANILGFDPRKEDETESGIDGEREA